MIHGSNVSDETRLTPTAYKWMPKEVGAAFLYAPWVAAPIMWLGSVLLYHSILGLDGMAVLEWLGYVLVLGVPLNYAALVVLGIPACYVLLRRQTKLSSYVLVGAAAGALTSWLWPGWNLHGGWAMIGMVVGVVNGLVIGRAAERGVVDSGNQHAKA
jgi:hypothetical protein